MNKETIKLYHLTTEANATKILKTGLKPHAGKRSKLAGDERYGIFLCEKKDIAYWQIILNLPVLLEVTFDADKLASEIESKVMDYFKYTYYSEHIYTKDIPASNIKRVTMQLKTKRAMQRLCVSETYSISRFCELCARYYDEDGYYYGDKELYEDLVADVDTLLFVLPHLDFGSNKKSVINAIKQAGENCMYTLCDWYYNEGKRLYQKLIEYSEDELTRKRNKLYRFIVKNLDGCLEVNTGGWCG